MKVYEKPYPENWKELCARPTITHDKIFPRVQEILNDVKRSGDEAILRMTEMFDGVKINDMRVPEIEIKSAKDLLPSSLQSAISAAKKNIEKFHSAQRMITAKVETMPGVSCWQKSVAIEKVGLYIPGGSAPLFSTVLMLGVPARIAGCKEVILCTPPGVGGRIDPAILYAADLVGINKVYRAGGAQAIAGMAFGTKTIPQVYKIFGPGNQYVTVAKQMLAASGIAIDLPAGPTELAIICDDSARPDFVAADILSQLEHGHDSQVVVITTHKELIPLILNEIKLQGKIISRREFVESSLKNSKFLVFERITDCINFANEYAAEHLILAIHNADQRAEQIINAGSVFVGNYSPESVGDYASGTNHTLPTNGYAKAWSGVSLDSFIKKITFQKLTEEGIRNIAPIVDAMAQAEGLSGHRAAALIRLKK